MPSQLINNEAVSFVVAKPLKWYDHYYEPGDDFPQEDANNIETLIRSRYLVPVVDDIKDKPRHWHREVQVRDAAIEKIMGETTQLVLPEIVGGEAVQNVPAEGDQPAPAEVADSAPPDEPVESQEPSEAEAEAAETTGEAVHTGEYDPTYHTVQEVVDYMDSHADERAGIIERERAGKNRKGIVEGY